MILLVPGVEGHRHEKFSVSPASLPATNFKVQNIWNNLEGVVGCQKCQIFTLDFQEGKVVDNQLSAICVGPFGTPPTLYMQSSKLSGKQTNI
jgi:hypothetical protein